MWYNNGMDSMRTEERGQMRQENTAAIDPRTVDYSLIDLHMHTTASDGTDTPEEILRNVREAGVRIFSVTDHDAVMGSRAVREILRKEETPGEPVFFVTGAEFSAKDDFGKYHILGYGYDPDDEAILAEVNKAHGMRLRKVKGRLEFLKERFGFTFTEQELAELFAHNNPGKPHIANLMLLHGYAKSKKEAIHDFINQKKFPTEFLEPEEVIGAILKSGGVPVLAHPVYGSGDELFLGEELEERIRRLMNFGLAGVEAFYSGFTDRMTGSLLQLSEKYDLYVTAGSDYHGKNKLIPIGETNCTGKAGSVPGLDRFLARMMDPEAR